MPWAAPQLPRRPPAWCLLGVSEVLSSLSEDVNIGLRYLPSASGAVVDPDAALTQDVFEMDLGLNLLNDRLKISGTLGGRTEDGLQIKSKDLTARLTCGIS